jgi:hypothetical protein
MEEVAKASEHILLPPWFPMLLVDDPVVPYGKSKAPERILLSPCTTGVSTVTAAIFESAQASEHILLLLIFAVDKDNDLADLEASE